VDHTTSNPSRRDFLFVATASVGAVGLAAAAVPLVDQMSPDRATIAAGAPISVDISQIAPGQQIQVSWRSKPIMIVNRPPEALKVLPEPKLTEQLSDPDSEVHQQPSYARNWHRGQPGIRGSVRYLHPSRLHSEIHPEPNPTSPAADWLGGYFCPCHGSLYDLAGRVFAGVPAPYNRPVALYRFENDTTIRIGENPPGVNFDLGEITAL
jgi:ubiquinol-cytochrome c reductase iron-sulfur subunit